ncbi:MAG: bifunctional glutamate N-acetyltransferase/amino-acid acetyltransferase ArgJ [Gammaproteobacteria bacterium]|nr:bifunctional glutamate N-acetyltransferase/amino-acid acetyltransferase ArgJ [Gammaproteobacteria bacterium]
MSDTAETPSDALAVAGVRLAAVASGVRYADRLDLVLVELGHRSSVCGVFTRNAFCAAPVVVARQHLQSAATRYFLINAGNANAGTGEQGEDAALKCCSELARLTGVTAEQVLPFSTGVIGEPLPVQKILSAMPTLLRELDANGWHRAAMGIMTTDTCPKLASSCLTLAGRKVVVSGIAKGAGMLRPKMATMLAYICTDLEVARPELQSLLQGAVSHSFNRITVDGDTSTNDSCMLAATGESGVSLASLSETERVEFAGALGALCTQLATALIRDAEGASKFVTVTVSGGLNSAECLRVAYTIAESPLVKTALFASDPNWGRILAAVGRSDIEALDISKVTIFLGGVLVVDKGSVAPTYRDQLGQQEMDHDDISIAVKLGRGTASETVWTSDLSHDYVRINAGYRT